MTTFLIACLAFASQVEERPAVLVTIGAAGTDEYGAQFAEWAERWRDAALRGDSEVTIIGGSSETNAGPEEGPPTDHERLQAAIRDLPPTGRSPVWVVLIGHGTFDGREAKFNLRGPDLGVDDLNAWLTRLHRPIVVVNCSSASGPFLKGLSKQNRVVVTAARSGDEQNFARFGDYISAAIADPSADLDKDDQVSLLEAFLTASKRVEEFYRTEARLATEHALLDDNGDGLGTPADWFRGVRATKRAKDGADLDGARARQIHLVPSARESNLSPEAQRRRDELELELEDLRSQKERLDEAEYYDRLQTILVELSRLYQQATPEGEAEPRPSGSD
ncbi:MAG: hypothetical protein M3552_13600 [Planctomycetota bacterium]|nr:hypothetical protein [Planctomycetota bacterium]